MAYAVLGFDEVVNKKYAKHLQVINCFFFFRSFTKDCVYAKDLVIINWGFFPFFDLPQKIVLNSSQVTFLCSKATMEIPGKRVKKVQN